MLTIVALITAWAVVVGSLSGLIGSLPMLLQVLLYVFLGVIWIWILPLRQLLTWMETGHWRR